MAVVKVAEGQAELPTPQSTNSFWHQQPAEKLVGHRTTDQLPQKADVVIVGSGITGAFAARDLVSGDDGYESRTVVMLEAREACWGATGRNGGHCQPLLYATKPQIARFEMRTYEILQDLISEKGIDCDWRGIGGVHAYESKDAFDLVIRAVRSLQRKHPDLAAHVKLVTDPRELRELRVGHAAGAVVQPIAAQLWPYKLVAWVLQDVLARNEVDETSGEGPRFNLQTNTPATRLQRSGDSWIVHTPRGQIAARDVLLATNAYTSHLLPKFTRLVVPVRGQVCALEPPSGARDLEHSHLWVGKSDSDDYLIQRDSGGPLILGGERLAAVGGEVGVSRDDQVDPDIGRYLRRALRSAVKLRPDDDQDDPESLPATWEWTGIMGYSADGCPWVGAVPEALGGGPGLWLAAGYTGHGMPTAAQCAMRVVEMMKGQREVDMPEEFAVSEERARREPADVMMGGMNGNLVEDLKMMAEKEYEN